MTYALVLNSGSSSIKFQVLDPTADANDDPLVSGLVEQIGEPQGTINIKIRGEKHVVQEPIADHSVGLQRSFEIMTEHGVGPHDVDISAVGHRVVHGGKVFSSPEIINDQVVEMIRDLIPLAPLHNPANVDGIVAAERALPDAHHVAVFDTAFHRRPPLSTPSTPASPVRTASAATASTAPPTSSSRSRSRRCSARTPRASTRSSSTWATVPPAPPSRVATRSTPPWA